MEEKEIVENNKLIAEFMGTPNSIGGNIPFIYEIGEPLPFSSIICTNENILDEILREVDEFGSELTPYITWYHNSWDWLMPVVEKILIISNELNNIEKFSVITDQVPYINEVYKAVVEFIKWYNGKIDNN